MKKIKLSNGSIINLDNPFISKITPMYIEFTTHGGSVEESITKEEYELIQSKLEEKEQSTLLQLSSGVVIDIMKFEAMTTDLVAFRFTDDKTVQLSDEDFKKIMEIRGAKIEKW